MPNSDGSVHRLRGVESRRSPGSGSRVLPGWRRVPRPTHWAYRPSERVGRAIATHDTPGSSKPSVRTPTLVRTWVRPSRKSARACARASAAHGAVDDARGHAERVRARAQRFRAWLTVTQNAIVRRSRASSWIDRATSALRSSMSTASASSSSSKSSAARATARVRSAGGRDAEAAQRRQEAVVDQLGQGARVDDLLEHLVEALAVAARGGGGEAEQRAGRRRARTRRAAAGRAGCPRRPRGGTRRR